MQTNASKISMSGAPFVRSTLIKSCLCDDSTESTNRDLLGVCGFYILTDDRNLLRYYPLQPDLGEWLSDQLYKATGKRDAFQVIPRLSQFYDGSEVEEPEATVGPLFAIATRADGNCLLHAISICLWGVEDKSDSEVSIIRKALKGFMQRNQFVLFQHYKCAEKRFDQILLGGIETADSDYSKQMDYEIACLDDNKKYLTVCSPH